MHRGHGPHRLCGDAGPGDVASGVPVCSPGLGSLDGRGRPLFYAWQIFLGSSLAMRHRLHLQITVLLDRVTGRPRACLDFLTALTGLGFLAGIIWGSLLMIRAVYPVQAGSFPISTSYLYCPFPWGCSRCWPSPHRSRGRRPTTLPVAARVRKRSHDHLLCHDGGAAGADAARLPVAVSMGLTSVFTLGVLRGFDAIPWDMLAQRIVYGVTTSRSSPFPSSCWRAGCPTR